MDEEEVKNQPEQVVEGSLPTPPTDPAPTEPDTEEDANDDDAKNPTDNDNTLDADAEATTAADENVCSSDHEQEKERLYEKFSATAPPALTAEDSWDYSLRPGKENSLGQGATIWVGDPEFQRKLDIFNGFEKCDHEAVKIPCPCTTDNKFIICKKCYRVFCGAKCLKQSRESKNAEEPRLETCLANENVIEKVEDDNSQEDAPVDVVQQKDDNDSEALSPKKKATKPQVHGQRKNEIVHHLNGNTKNYRKQPSSGNYQNPVYTTPSVFPMQQLLLGPVGPFQYPQQPMYPTMPNVPVLFPPQHNGQGLLGPGPSVSPVQPSNYQRLNNVPRHMNASRMPPGPHPPRFLLPRQPFPNDIGRFTRPPLHLHANSAWNIAQPEQDSRENTTESNEPTLLHNYQRQQQRRHSERDARETGHFDVSPNKPHYDPNHLRTGNREEKNDSASSRRKLTAVTGPARLNFHARNERDQQPASLNVDVIRKQPTVVSGSSGVPFTESSEKSETAFNSNNRFQQKIRRKMPRDRDGSGRDRISCESRLDAQPLDPDIDVPSEFQQNNTTVPTRINPNEPLRKPTGSSAVMNPLSDFSFNSNQTDRTTDGRLSSVKYTDEQKNPPKSHESLPMKSDSSPFSKGFGRGSVSLTAAHNAVQVNRPGPERIMSTSPSSHSSKSKPITSNSALNSQPYILFNVPMQVKMAFFESLSRFFVSTGFGENHRNILESKILEHQNQLEDLVNPTVGDFCLAFYDDGESSGWYRAQIMKMQGDEIMAYFVDFGNTDTCKIYDVNLKQLPSPLMDFPPCAVGVTVRDFNLMEGVTDDVFDQIREILREKSLRISIKKNAGTEGRTNQLGPCIFPAEVEVFIQDDWFNLTDILIASFGEIVEKVEVRSLVKNEDIPRILDEHCEIEVLLTHVKSLKQFYVVQTQMLPERRKLEETLSKRCNIPLDPISAYGANYSCAATRGNQWARAKIVEVVEEGKVSVRFMDYGDEKVVSLNELRALPPDSDVNVKGLACRCSLPLVYEIEDFGVSMLQTIQQNEVPVVLVSFGVEPEMNLFLNLVEVYQGKSSTGLSGSLLKRSSDYALYTWNGKVDLNIRKALKVKQSIEGSLSHDAEPYLSGNPTDGVISKKEIVCKEKNTVAAIPVPMNKNTAPIPSSSLELSKSVETRHPQEKRRALPPPYPANNNNPKDHTDSCTISVKKDQFNTIPPKTTSQNSLPSRLKQLQPLKNYLNSDFKIVSRFAYNRLAIKPLDFMELEMRVQDAIYECMESEQKLTTPPSLNTMVIALHPKQSNNFHRAMVINVKSNANCTVKFVDFGDEIVIEHWQSLTPASDDLFQFPKLFFEVLLQGIEADPLLALSSDYNRLMERIQRLPLRLKQCMGDHEPYTVNLMTKQSADGESLSTRILKLQLWEWETICNKGFTKDTDLLSRSKYEECPPMLEHLRFAVLPRNKTLRGSVSRFTSEGDVYVVQVEEPDIARDFSVINHQIRRYVDKVTPSNFVPRLQEIVLIYIPDKPELQSLNLHGTGRWNRCIQEFFTEYRNIDLDEVYSTESPLKDLMIVRKMPPEFVDRLGMGLFECRLKDFKPTPAIVKQIQDRFKRGSPISFTVHNVDEDNVHVITIDGFPS